MKKVILLFVFAICFIINTLSAQESIAEGTSLVYKKGETSEVLGANLVTKIYRQESKTVSYSSMCETYSPISQKYYTNPCTQYETINYDVFDRFLENKITLDFTDVAQFTRFPVAVSIRNRETYFSVTGQAEQYVYIKKKTSKINYDGRTEFLETQATIHYQALPAVVKNYTKLKKELSVLTKKSLTVYFEGEFSDIDLFNIALKVYPNKNEYNIRISEKSIKPATVDFDAVGNLTKVVFDFEQLNSFHKLRNKKFYDIKFVVSAKDGFKTKYNIPKQANINTSGLSFSKTYDLSLSPTK
ncbi:MAG: hypothetical protein JNM93_00790 [Bacteriovoracaceae bacterium]|nr:hypothetical protein [Bacteriovoracaceae bacterium]